MSFNSKLIKIGICIMGILFCSTGQAQENSVKNKFDSIVLGSGCFWGAEKRYQAIPGVIEAVSGYTDGKDVAPNYAAITKSENQENPNNHAEVVKVTYDPSKVSFSYLLKNFFENHNPTQVNGQGNDIGTQYRSSIFFSTDYQRKMAESLRDDYQILLNKAAFGKIVTQIKLLDEFYPAEEYHQNYLFKNSRGYCPNHATGVKFKNSNEHSAYVDNSALLKGKQIVVLTAEFCPYCEQFKEDVASRYEGSIALHYRTSEQLDTLTLTTETWATPTIFFIEDGVEKFAHQGYLSSEKFYKALGAFKLGKDSKEYEIAFESGTESRFCRQYDDFKKTGDGTFIDKLSGEALFDTKDRFDSGSGWLSFTSAITGSIVELADNSLGVQRVEVKAKTSGIHLGHVFEDGPNGGRRFCINAKVLEFSPR